MAVESDQGLRRNLFGVGCLVMVMGCGAVGGTDDAAPAPVTLSPSTAPAAPGAERPHVLLITVDALRADHLGVYGHPRGTSPFIDRFANDAWVFEHAYAAAPNSSYSMCAMLTSEYISERVQLGAELPDVTLASVFSDAGYRVEGFYIDGIFYTDGARLGAFRDAGFGFDLHHRQHRAAEELTDDVLARYRAMRDEGEPPTFFWVHYFDVHEPYRATSFGEADEDRYDSEILRVDQQIERLWTELGSIVDRDVIVAIAADHGEEFREHGGLYHGSSAYEEQIRIPLLIRVPNAPPRREPAPVSLVDLAPTLLDIVGLVAPASMRGRSLTQPVDPRPVFASVGHRRMIVDWPWKLITDPRTLTAELYTLADDPHERVNLAEARPQEVSRMRRLGAGWVEGLRAPANESPSADTMIRARDLGRLRDQRAVPGLSATLWDPAGDEANRVEAIALLGQIGSPDAVGVLRQAWRSPALPQAMRRELALTLGNRGDTAVRARLVRLLEDHEPTVRARAATGLGHLGDRRAVPELANMVRGETSPQRDVSRAIYWLGRLGDSRGAEALADVASRETRHRYRASRALGEIGGSAAVEALTVLLHMPNRTTVRDAILEALGRAGDPSAGEAVLEVTRAYPDATQGPPALLRLGMQSGGRIAGFDLGPGAARRFTGTRPRCAGVGTGRRRSGCTFGAADARLRVLRPRNWSPTDLQATLAMNIRAPSGTGSLRVAIDGREPIEAVAREHWTDLRVPVGDIGQGLRLSIRATEGPVELDYLLVY